MSIDSITTDGFAALPAEALVLAVYILSQRIGWLRRRLRQPALDAEDQAAFLDELRHLQTVLKVHVDRLHELLEEQPPVEAEPAVAA